MRVLCVLGTRPEAIKLAPLVRALGEPPGRVEVGVCVTGQHREMLAQALGFFGVAADWDLAVMTPGQGLAELTSRVLAPLAQVIDRFRPDYVVVQGDTTTALAGALAAFYARRPVCHVEAGLRTRDARAPFPEEMNRVLVARLADLHFAPTERARANLAAEGITERVWVVGQTGIDALRLAQQALGRDPVGYAARFDYLPASARVVLATGHRRESAGGAFEEIALGLRDAARSFPDVHTVFPLHPSPPLQEPARRVLGGEPNVHLVGALGYPEMVWLLGRAHLVVTDSGGLQEEAPALGRPVLVTRDVTERPEPIEAGTAKLVGTGRARIASELGRLLADDAARAAMARVVLPYGDGEASGRIREILLAHPRAGRLPLPSR